MNLLESMHIYDKQIFQWGEISWLHEPMNSPYRRLSVAQVNIYPGCQQEKHFHLGEEQLFYVVQGQGIFVTNGKKENIHKPMIVYIPPHSEHEVLNTGKEDLIFTVVYVPINLVQLEKPYMVNIYKNIQDVISIEILQNIKEQLSEILKLVIHIYDGNHQPITKIEEEDDFCKMCKSVHQCNKRKYESKSTNKLFDNMYKCDFDLIQLEIPIALNDNILGYIKSGSFILSNSKDIDKRIDEMSKKLGTGSSLIWTSYKKKPDIIKSRIYVIQEHLLIAAQFIQVMVERSIMEHELIEKDNEILINTKEKIQLKDALKKANDKIYNDKIFAGGSGLVKDIVYPYDLELVLESAIKDIDIEKVENSIEMYRNKYIDSENIVKEMIIVLSRTALRNLENIEIVSHIRKKYNKHLQQIKREDSWEILKQFCNDCIEEYKKVLQRNGKELIHNINMYINTHYKEDLNLNLIAEIFYISPNYLSSIFNKKNHMSFSDYVNELRIQEAKRYLRNTKIKVCDISKNVGYKNNSYFVNIFKKNVGMTPNKYRKNLTE